MKKHQKQFPLPSKKISLGRRDLIKTVALAPLAPLLGGWSLWPGSTAKTRVKMFIRGNRRIVEANGIPNHKTGSFPNHNDPFGIKEQHHIFSMPAKPEIADKVSYLVGDGFWNFGVAVNGLSFDPAGPYYKGDRATGWHFEVMSTQARPFLGLDQNNAHVQPGGGYHYHGLPHGLLGPLVKAGGGKPRMILLGYAADGFPAYAPVGYEKPDDPQSPLKRLVSSYRMKVGLRPSEPGGWYDGAFVQDYEYREKTGDLDDCNGRYGVTPDYPDGIYHYIITDAFPFIPRYFRGTPDRSFRHSRGPGLGEVPPQLRNFPA